MVERWPLFQTMAAYTARRGWQSANGTVFIGQPWQIGVAGGTAQAVMVVCTAQQARLGGHKARKFCADVKQAMG
jgi:hypothetical protein